MSDSHGRNINVQDILEREKDADFYLHCGDLCSDPRQFPNVYFVEGNCDYNPEMPEYRVVECGKYRIFMTHSDGMWNRQYELAKLAVKKKCQIVCYGHTHVPVIEEYKGLWLVNPGALSYNRDGSEIGYVVIDIEDTDLHITRKVL